MLYQQHTKKKEEANMEKLRRKRKVDRFETEPAEAGCAALCL